MPIKPTGIPFWATSGSGVVEPTDAKKAIGWGATGTSGERPPAEYFNWQQNMNAAWIKYLQYDRVIEDDFVKIGMVPPISSGGSPTFLAPFPLWQLQNAQGSCLSEYVTAVMDGSVGHAQFFVKSSGIVAIAKGEMYGPEGNDFIFGGRAQVLCQSPSGMRFFMGLSPTGVEPFTSAYGFGFGFSGPTGPLVFRYEGTHYSIVPTAGATALSQFTSFNAEKVGATLKISVDGVGDVYYGSVPTLTSNALLVPVVHMGAYFNSALVPLTRVEVDYFRLWVRRNGGQFGY